MGDPSSITSTLQIIHDESLKELYHAINSHKEYLQGLVQQAQEEIAAVVASSKPTEADTAHGEAPSVTEELAAAPIRSKRKQPAVAVAEAEEPSQPAKRRGRPRKQLGQPAIPEAAEERQHIQQWPADTEQAAVLQQPVSADVHAAAANVAAMDADPLPTADEAAAPKRRATRSSRAETKPAAPSAASTRGRPKRIAAQTSSRSTRSRRAAAAEPDAAQPSLEAIAEEPEQQHVHSQEHQLAAFSPQQAEQQHDIQGNLGAQGTLAEAEQQLKQLHEVQEQQEQLSRALCLGSADIDEGPAGTTEQPIPTGNEAPTSADAMQGGAAADGNAADVAVLQQAVKGAAPDDDLLQNSPPAQQEDEVQRQQQRSNNDSASELLVQPVEMAAAAASAPPKTPGFSLRPSNQQQQSDTPCMGGSIPNSSRPRQAKAAAVTRLASASPMPAASNQDSTVRNAGVVSIQRPVLPGPGTASTRRKGGSGLPVHSLSFGQALQGPLFDMAAESPAAAGAEQNAAGAGFADAAPATGTSDWQAFLSTVHAGDAPTPAHSRQRASRQSGAASGQQRSGLRSAAGTPASCAAAAASGAPHSRKASHAQQLFAESPAAGLASVGRVTRYSMQQQQRSPSLQPVSPAAEGCVGETAQTGRHSRVVTPRSGKKSVVATAIAVFEAAAVGCTSEVAAAAAKEDNMSAEASFDDQQQQHGLEQHIAVDCVDLEIAGQKDAGMEKDDTPALDHVTEAVDQDETVVQELEDEPYSDTGEDVQRQQEEDVEEHQHDENAGQAAANTAADSDTAAATGAEQAVVAAPKPATAAGYKGTDKLSAWLAATAAATAAGGEKTKQQLEAADEKAPAKSNLVSGIRSFVPAVVKKEAPPPAAGKVKVKVKAIEAAQAARQAEEARAAEKAARHQQQQHAKGRTAGAAGKPPGTPSGAVAQSKVAAVEKAATGLAGSGGALRVPAGKQHGEEEPAKPADRDAAQKKAEKDAEAAKRAMDKAEREERMKRAEQKRKEEEMKRRAELAEKQRLKEERLAAAAALKGSKPVGAAGSKATGSRVAGTTQAPDAKPKQNPAAATAADPNSYKTPAASKAAARVPGPAAADGAQGHDAEGCGDSPSLTIKLLDPVSTGGKAAAHGHHHHEHKGMHQHDGAMGPPASVSGKTPAAFKTPAPPVSEQEKRNVEALKSSPYVNPGSKRTPYAQQQQQDQSYIISPFRDDDVETPDRSHKPIPDWARSASLYEAVKAQQHIDPDNIFAGKSQKTCDLADMFTDVPGAGPQPHHRHKVRKLGQRTSSGDWSQDRLTWQEEISYKKQAGWL